MSKEKQKPIYIFDHPESRIRFLEATLDGQDWRATIVYPDAGPISLANLQAVSRTLSQRGYLLQRGVDPYGHPTLEVHHVGIGTSPLELWREMGIARGTMHTLLHPGMALGEYLHQAKRGVTHTAKLMSDPARANGVFFTVAEVFLTLAGLGNKSDPLPSKELLRTRRFSNLLQSGAGLFFLGQSLIYLLFAKSNDDIVLASVKRQMAQSAEAGTALGRIRFDPETEKQDTGIFAPVTRFLKRYPIHLGAMSNNIGMGLYIGHIFAQKKLMGAIAKLPGMPEKTVSEAISYSTKDWKKGLIGCIISLIGWTTMMLPRKQKSEVEDSSHIPARGLIETLKENPQYVTGVLAAGSSSMRLAESLSPGKRNRIQTIGESIYLPGDLLLFGIKNDHYGTDNIKDVEGISKKIAAHVNDLPVVLGQQMQREAVENIAHYLTEKRIATLAKEHKLTPELRTTITQRSNEIVAATLAHIAPEQNSRLLHVAHISNRIVERFPESAQAELRQRLNTAMVAMPWLQSSVAELQQLAAALPPATNPHTTSATVSMKEVAADIAALLKIVPDVEDGASAAKLYDAFAPYMEQRPRSSVAAQGAIRDDRVHSAPDLHPHVVLA